MKTKKWSTRKIGKGVKIPKSKNMLGIKTNSTSLETQIKKLRLNQRKKIIEIKTTLKEIEQHVIAISNLTSLEKSSIKRIQSRRDASILSIIRSVSDLAVLNRKIKKLERSFKEL